MSTTGTDGTATGEGVLLGTKEDGAPVYFTRRMARLLDASPFYWNNQLNWLRWAVTKPVQPLPASVSAFRTWVLEQLGPEAPAVAPTFREVVARARRAKRLASHRYPSVQVGYLKRGDTQHPIHMSGQNLHDFSYFTECWKHLRSKPEMVSLDAKAFESAEGFYVWTREKLDAHHRAIWRQIEIGKIRGTDQAYFVASDALLPNPEEHELPWLLLLWGESVDPVTPGLFDTLEGFEDWFMDAVDAARRPEAALEGSTPGP